MYRRQTSGQRSSSAKPNSPLAGDTARKVKPRVPLATPLGAARSLPGTASAPLADDAPMPLLSTLGVTIPGQGGSSTTGMLSPQTTGGVGDHPGRSRRGPQLATLRLRPALEQRFCGS